MITYTKGSFTIGNHDAYTLGQFRDDCLQYHTHQSLLGRIHAGRRIGELSTLDEFTTWDWSQTTNSGNTSSARFSSVTHGKQIGVNYLIKAL